jgi:hypothetical protein
MYFIQRRMRVTFAEEIAAERIDAHKNGAGKPGAIIF